MKVLVFGINYAPDLIGVAKYTTDMCEFFRAAGHDVTVVTAPPYYPQWKIPEAYKGLWYKRDLVDGVSLIRCPLYVPRSPTGVKRLLHHFSFALSSAPAMAYAALRVRPDVVLAIAPSIFGAPGAALAGMLVGASRWLHLQDLEVDEAFDLGFLSGAAFRRTALALERATLGLFQRVSSISPKMVAALRSKGIPANRLVEFNNWVDTNTIRPLSRPTALRKSLRISSDATVAVYSGNMGTKQGLEYLATAAHRLAPTRPDIIFLFCGSGSMRERLRA
ncbi:MAG TPA: WcaI family glycosyltransferase, partial [Terriglobales bacterium]|nr:WcaI family glycosyltransferase [Terriglobales bacterium]